MVMARDSLIEDLSAKYEQMREDFKYNLDLIEHRDKEIDRLSRYFELMFMFMFIKCVFYQQNLDYSLYFICLCLFYVSVDLFRMGTGNWKIRLLRTGCYAVRSMNWNGSVTR